ncbi:Tryp_alpha_amyl domain-containing protein [Cephalotus follicularis]|uniref:Tryp_alpha_amyl domain-containing protein n=1 Tax=Cephalotus follicularis TaxID=3775 RepID=A0A1Q3AYD7_CEPFO|nr:Tryp_alpha_amyl domain-containing protein [Cephalotus follicularis]
MAKLALLLATFTVLLLVTNASIYRTTIEIDEENPRRGQQSCREQIQRQQHLNDCQQHLVQESQESGSSWGQGRGRRDDQQQQHLQRCCEQLQQLDTGCRCQGIQQAVQQAQKQEQLRREEVQELYDVARNLPSMCNLSPRRCEMRSNWWF